MPRARRSRVIAADRGAVWRVVADPHHLPRWWPKVARVEDVYERERGAGTRWTEVLQTASGKGVKAEFRCRRSREPELYEWEQEIDDDSPFAKVFKTSVTRVGLDPQSDGTRVTLELEQQLRGLSRLGGFMVRRASGGQLDAALDALEAALVEGKKGG